VSNASGTSSVNVTNVSIICGNAGTPFPDNPPSTVAVSTSTIGYFKGGEANILTGSYIDDSQNSAYPTYSANYTYSYNWQTNTSGCTISGGTLDSASVNCTWGADEAARLVSVRVGFSDGRNTMVYSTYLSVNIFNPAFTFATTSGSTLSNRGLDPDLPGSFQTAIDTAYNNAGRSKVAVKVGTYNITASTAVTMRNGISVYGRYTTDWFARNTKSTVTHLNSTNSSIITQNHTATYGYGFYFSSLSSNTVLDGMTLITDSTPGVPSYHYGAYINGGNPVIQNNYFVSSTTPGFNSSVYFYPVYCSSCYAIVQKNLIDLYNGYGMTISSGSPSGAVQFYNNIIRMDQGRGIYVSQTGTNLVYLINNSIMNRYATKSTNGTGIYIYGSATASEPVATYILNNNISAQYGAYEATTYSNPRFLYDNNISGPTGFTAYYDQQSNCTANGDADSNSKTCTVADANAAWTTVVYPYNSGAGGFFYGNFSLSPSMRYSGDIIGSTSFTIYIIGDYFGTQTSMLYGASHYLYGIGNHSISDDFIEAARTYTSTTGITWTTGATPYSANGISVGAFEHN
jgi:hypothetical protein